MSESIPIIGAAKQTFEDVAQNLARAIASILPRGFKFVLLMVAPDQSSKMLYSTDAAEAQGIVNHFANDGARRRIRLTAN